MHVFTYGSLMFPEVWNVVVGRQFATVDGTAFGYAIYRIRDAVFPGITPAAFDDGVNGVVYLDVDDDSLARLDRFEGDFYRRESLAVDCRDGHCRTADAYVVPAENRAALTAEHWHAEKFVSTGGLGHFLNRFAGFARLDGR